MSEIFLILVLVVVLIVLFVKLGGIFWEEATATGYPALVLLRHLYVLCAIADLIAVIVGIAMGQGYLVLAAALSAPFFLGMAAAIGLATDVARYTKQIAGDLRELRLGASELQGGKSPADRIGGKATGEPPSGITGYRKI
jgi:hypothetical protein